MNDKDRRKEGFLGQRMLVTPLSIRKTLAKNPLINSLYITDIGYYPRAGNHYRERPEGTEQFILIYCIEGEGWIKMDGEIYELKPNSYFIIPANKGHQYGSTEEDPWSIYWVHFTGTSAANLYQKFLVNNSLTIMTPEIIQVSFEERRITLFEYLITLLESGYGTRIMEYVNISLWHLISSFIYHDFYSKTGSMTLKSDFIQSAISYMKEHLDQSISVEELADHLNYSVSYFYSIFKDKTGYSPIHYFNNLKIQKACQYLSFTDMNIKQISYKLGFNDPFYFSRTFKKVMEVSPTEYRNQNAL